MKRGKFITFEGSEACGKTTQIEALIAWLQGKGIDAIPLREPGGTPLCEEIRNLLKHHPAGRGMSPETELLLFAASRAELVRKVIEPCLASGKWIVCDRFHDSTTVYQGIARGLGLDAVNAIQSFVLGSLRPDLTLILHVDPAEAKRRLATRSLGESCADRMEAEPDEFFEKVREGYRLLASKEPERVHWIEASSSKEEVFSIIKKEVQHALHLALD